VGGTFTAINWGNLIASLPDTFITTQVYAISGYRFNEFFAQGKHERLVKFFYTLLDVLLLFSFIVTCVLWICSAEIASIINFKKNFTSQSLEVLSNSIKYLSVIPLFNILTFLCTRIFAAAQKINKIIVISAVGQMALFASIWFGITRYEYIGYLKFSVLGFGIIMMLNSYLLFRLFPLISFSKVAGIVGSHVAFGALAIIVFYFVKPAILTLTANPFIIILSVSFGVLICMSYKIKRNVITFLSKSD
jgi:O-antigen/teichoic acid export membrane protein